MLEEAQLSLLEEVALTICHEARWEMYVGMGFAARGPIMEDSAERIAGYHGFVFDPDLYRAVKMFEGAILKTENEIREKKAAADKAQADADAQAKRDASDDAIGYN